MTHIQHRPVVEMVLELDTRDLTTDFLVIAKKYGATLWEVMGPRRFSGITAARHECMHLLRERGWSFPRIGLLFDRDHTTVMAAVEKHAYRLAQALLTDLARVPTIGESPCEREMRRTA